MNKTSSWLSGLLALQLVVAGGLFIGTQSASTGLKPAPLLAFQPANVDRIRVSDGKKEVTLAKDNGQWQLPGLQNLPVNPTKLEGVLQQLNELKTTWPVTTSKSSHNRLEVGTDKFSRRVSLYAGDKLLDQLFLGTSPGFKQVYSRPSDDDKVYTLSLNTYDFPVDAFDWLDKGLLDVKNAQLIQEKDLKLVKSGSEWKLDEAGVDASQNPAPVELDSDKVARITQALSAIQVTSVAEKKPDFSNPAAVSLKVKGDGDWTFHLVQNEGKYYIKRDDIDAVFTIGQPAFNNLTSVEKKDLLASNVQGTSQAETSGAAPAPSTAADNSGG